MPKQSSSSRFDLHKTSLREGDHDGDSTTDMPSHKDSFRWKPIGLVEKVIEPVNQDLRSAGAVDDSPYDLGLNRLGVND